MSVRTRRISLNCPFGRKFFFEDGHSGGEGGYAHVILTAEAGSLPTDEQKLLEDYG